MLDTVCDRSFAKLRRRDAIHNQVPSGHLPALTAIRFFAAAAIVLFHMQGKWGIPPVQQTGLAFGVGVDLFFALSGFILAYNYREVSGIGDALKVIAFRIARIWPLHLLMLTLFYVALYDPAGPFGGFGRMIASVFLVQAWVGDYTYALSGNAVAWTLSVELFFYLMFPFLTMLSSRMIAVVTFAIAILTIMWATQAPGAVSLTHSQVSGPAIMRMHPGAFLVIFSAGIITARYFVSRDWPFDRASATALEIAAVVPVIVFFLYHHSINNVIAGSIGLTGHLKTWLHHLLGALFFCPMIFILAVGRGAISSALSIRVFILLGESSFALYLFHQITMNWMLQLGLKQPIYILPYIFTIILGSILLFKFVEKPSNLYLRQKIKSISSSRSQPL